MKIIHILNFQYYFNAIVVYVKILVVAVMRNAFVTTFKGMSITIYIQILSTLYYLRYFEFSLLVRYIVAKYTMENKT